MSRIRANKITNKVGTGAIELEKGAHLPVGMGITGAGTINISGSITGSSFSGDGSGLIGVASTDNIITGTAATFNTYPVDINAGMTVAGVSTMAAITATTGTFSGNVSVGGTLTYEDVTNIDSVGIVTARAGIFVADSQAIHLGNAALNGDLRIYHDGASNHSFIRELGTGSLYIDSNQLYLRQANNNNVLLQTTSAGAVQINYDGSQKIATSNTGITVTGTVAATAFTGDASGLTGLPGITTEQATVSGGVVTLDLSKDDHKVVASGTYTVNVSGGTEAGSHTLRIENSGISTVGFSTYFKFPSGGTPSLPTASGAISLISFTVHKVGSVGVATVLLSGASVNFS